MLYYNNTKDSIRAHNYSNIVWIILKYQSEVIAGGRAYAFGIKPYFLVFGA